MINWIKDKIYAEKDARILKLNNHLHDSRRKADYYRNQMEKAQTIVKRIELEHITEDVSSNIELKVILSEKAVPVINVVFATSPIDMVLNGTSPETIKQEIKLNTHHGMIIRLGDDEEFLGNLAHSTCLDLAHSIGSAVREQLMFQAGWRLPR